MQDGPRTEDAGNARRVSIGGRGVMCSDSDMRHPFTFTPSVSLFVTCETEVEFGERFAALSDGGKVFMPPDDCGVGRRFGWVADRFGVSWQLLVPAK